MTKSIVLEVCEQFKIHPVDFFGNCRDPKAVKARRVAIYKLKAAEFSNAAIARLMRRNYSTIQYWLFPNYRVKRAADARALRARKKQSETQIETRIAA